MIIKDKKKSRITWEKEALVPEEGRMEALAEAAWKSIAMVLLIFASVSMLATISPSLRLEPGDGGKILAFVGVTMFLKEVVLRILPGKVGERFAKPVKGLCQLFSALFIGLAFLKYFSAHKEEIVGGIYAAVSHYAVAYNKYFKANLVVRSGAEEFLSGALCFSILLLFFTLLYFSMLSQSYLWFLILPIFPLGLNMYVGLTPGYPTLAMAVLGGFMLLRKGGARGKLHSGMPIYLLLGGVLLLTGALFGEHAEKLFTYSEKAKEYQKQLEKGADSLLSGSLLAEQKSVNNSSPRYKDAKIMTVRLDSKPEGNLYFKDFYGEIYDGGEWRTEESAFGRLCRENGISPEKATIYLATALYDSGYLSKTQYQLRYEGVLGRSMLLPYGANADLIKGLLYKGDSVARKNVTLRRLSFEGLTNNLLVFNGLSGLPAAQGEEEQAFWEWYDAYVQETCMTIPDFMAQAEGVGPTAFPMAASSLLTSKESHAWKLYVASQVKQYLATSCVYDWELDPIEKGVDPIQYFLEEGHEGYCVHFASAGVLLLRDLGVPARYASGYVVKPSGFEQQEDGSYLAQVIDRNGHAWVEIYLDGMGWVPVEMTPGYDSRLIAMPTSKEAQQEREEKRAAGMSTDAAADFTEEEETPSEEAQEESGGSQSQGNWVDEEEEEEEDLASEEETAEESSHDSLQEQDDEESDEDGPGIGGWGDGDRGGGGSRSIVILLGWVAAAIGMTVVILLVIWAVRRANRRRLEEAIAKKYYKAAVLIMNRWIYQRLRRQGKIKSGNTTDREYEGTLNLLLGEERKEEVGEYMRIVKAAAFSPGRITREECRTVLRIYRRVMGEN